MASDRPLIAPIAPPFGAPRRLYTAALTQTDMRPVLPSATRMLLGRTADM